MTIIEVIRSGKRFKRKSWDKDAKWREGIDNPRCHHIGERADDILADDWEIEEKKIEITKIQLYEAFERAKAKEFYGEYWVDVVAKQLGF